MFTITDLTDMILPVYVVYFAPHPEEPGLLSRIVEARKLEHQYPHALKLEYRGS